MKRPGRSNDLDEIYARRAVFDKMIFMVWVGIKFEADAARTWIELCHEFSDKPERLIKLGLEQDWSDTVFASW